MNRKAERFVAGAGVLCSFWVSMLYAGSYHFAGGTGEPNDPYQIATAEQLVSIGSDPNRLDKHFVLLNDIDLDPNLPGRRAFTKAVIAPSDSVWYFVGVPFTGTFNGRGHSLKNLMFQGDKLSLINFVGLFGNVAKGAVVSDVRVTDADLKGNGNLHGILVAMNEGRIIRCGVSGKVRGSSDAGLLAGFNRGEIIDSWAEGDVTGISDIGGLVGFNSCGTIVNSHAGCRVVIAAHSDFNFGGGLAGQSLYGEIINCWATGDVSGDWWSDGLGGLLGGGSLLVASSYATGNVSVERGGQGLGGLVGWGGGTIDDCYATGNVSGGGWSSSLGGLVGGGARISDSYAIGRVSAGEKSTDSGGLVGEASRTQESFWNIETSGQTTSSGGAGLTTAQMQDAATYLAAGWDWAGERENGTADLWFIPEDGGYPRLTVHSAAFAPHKLEGSGTAEDPYRIATVEDLDAINHYDLAACYRLEADIDFAPSPRDKPVVRYFDGKLDGAGRVIRGLTIRGGNGLGLFGNLGACAAVTHLDIHDANITGSSFIGLLASRNSGCLTACRASGSITGGMALCILTGWNEGTISDSYGTGSVSAESFMIGGLTGWNVGSIRRCYAATRVSWSRTDIEPNGDAGGLVGANYEPPWSGVGYLKGLGTINGQVQDSCFLIDTDGGGPDNGCGTALTDARMKQQASFPGWDFDKTWMICEGKDSPRLRWENVPSEE